MAIDHIRDAQEFIDLFKALAYKESECTLNIHDPGESVKLAEMERIITNLLVTYHFEREVL